MLARGQRADVQFARDIAGRGANGTMMAVMAHLLSLDLLPSLAARMEACAETQTAAAAARASDTRAGAGNGRRGQGHAAQRCMLVPGLARSRPRLAYGYAYGYGFNNRPELGRHQRVHFQVVAGF